jgi:hypothetical protein
LPAHVEQVDALLDDGRFFAPVTAFVLARTRAVRR